MGQDNGLDAQLPISREGLLAALETALDITRKATNASREEKPRAYLVELTDYLAMLHYNIKNDPVNNYPPVVRKRFRHDETLI